MVFVITLIVGILAFDSLTIGCKGDFYVISAAGNAHAHICRH